MLTKIYSRFYNHNIKTFQITLKLNELKRVLYEKINERYNYIPITLKLIPYLEESQVIIQIGNTLDNKCYKNLVDAVYMTIITNFDYFKKNYEGITLNVQGYNIKL
jgi:hypothetical protein